ncbi:MAG: type I-E CRISPR-associated protein Cas7/Cse4/CasC [Atopobiaceae bacterium]|nr:type I-E CRISPR-associated protein Cas7/Cse4/CasC [Atopobiaceae bacterium]
MHKPLYVDIHVLQTVPPSCINRDDTGSPKTARFGGVRRARVSSQAWKKAIRDEFASLLDESAIGLRTMHAVAQIAGAIREALPDLTDADIAKMAEESLKATGIKLKGQETGYLLFISPMQICGLADLAVSAYRMGTKLNSKEAKAILNPKERPTLNAVDIALFGRMVADAPVLNIDASVQVAHAIGIEEAETEFDYFTAMDDLSPEDNAGAGMIGTVEYLSSTLYRYATLDVYHLYENLGSIQAVEKAVEAFLQAFVRSMPTGKQNTFANRTMPSAVMIQLRDTQPVSLANAFEKPVRAYAGKGTLEVACERLVKQEQHIDHAFGVAPKKTYVVCGAPGAEGLEILADEGTNMNEAVGQTVEMVGAYLKSCGFVDEGQD